MEQTAPRSSHPLVVIAAVAVTLFSLTGIAALMGWLPTSSGTPAPASHPALVADSKPVVQAPRVEAPVEPRAEHRRASRPTHRPSAATEPVFYPPEPRAPVQVAAAEPQYAPPAPPAPVAAAPVCRECGVIESVRAIQQQGSPSGVGAAAGGVLGGVVGHQVGNGRGRDLMTVIGAVGGAVAGHQIEKARKTTTSYQVDVRFDDGTSQRLTQSEAPTFKAGDRVRLVNGTLRSDS